MEHSQETSAIEVDIAQETFPDNVFIAPSILKAKLIDGVSYAHYSPCPSQVHVAAAPQSDSLPGNTNTWDTVDDHQRDVEPTPCVLGVDEAGRGPVLGPMVYSAFYLPINRHRDLLARDHGFDDSKALTPGVRSNLMRLLCTPSHPLHETCGWAVKVLSARDISSGMLRPGTGIYNLNAQAMDATIELIHGILHDRAVDVREIYIDTIGNPATYQKKLERIFPGRKITVAKKADSLYPCVSAASVVAKVTRDAGLEACFDAMTQDLGSGPTAQTWGSGYPSDSKCVAWLKNDMDSVFGWGTECRFSWGTAREMLETKGGVRVEWPENEDDADAAMRMTDFFAGTSASQSENDELRNWYGSRSETVLKPH